MSIIKPFRPYLEEWVADSGGRVRGDVCFQKLQRLGYRGLAAHRAARARRNQAVLVVAAGHRPIQK